jgi:hypothetical protein
MLYSYKHYLHSRVIVPTHKMPCYIFKKIVIIFMGHKCSFFVKFSTKFHPKLNNVCFLKNEILNFHHLIFCKPTKLDQTIF